MEKIIDVFKERPGKSVASLIVLIVSIVAILRYQEIRVETVKVFLDSISNNTDNSEMMWTWGINLLSLFFNFIMAWSWMKDIMSDDFYDPMIGRIVAFVIGAIHGLFVLVFIKYIFSNLTGIVIGVVAFVVVMWAFFGNDNIRDRKRRY
ncbi:hypothetical protein CON64_09710 [Bacillus pseudomycoides]|nr:hypothetical protein CON64_09710 [Bacillus pseudomycoides]